MADTMTDCDMDVIGLVENIIAENNEDMPKVKTNRRRRKNMGDEGSFMVIGVRKPLGKPSAAESKKEQGNQLYKTKKYVQAISAYTEAIELCPSSPAYYGNRSACFMMLHQYKDALEDARKSVLLDPNFVKGYIRISKCCLTLGDISAAENALSKASDIEATNPVIQPELYKIQTIKRHIEDGEKAYAKKDYRRVVYCMDRVLEQIPSARFKILKAECLALIGRYQEAQEIANDILHVDMQNADAIYVRGMCLYYEDNVDKAFTHFQHVLKLAPDHTKAMDIYKRAKSLKVKKEEGNDAFKAGRLTEAYSLYTEAMTIDPSNNRTNAKLYFNRATVSSRLGRLNESIADCTSALALDETYLKALLRRAKCYMDSQDFEEAVRDYEKAVKMDRDRESKRLLAEAKLALKKSKRKDYYKILGVDKNASSDDVKKAYRKRALVFHPDRHADATDVEKKEQERKFKEVGEAYGILSDPKKRARYDNGQDLEDMEGMNCHMDPSTVFSNFFGEQGGGQSFSFNGGGNGGGFPGGFAFQFG